MIPNIDVFAQFGIAGLILGVFFATLMVILKLHATTIKELVNRFTDDSRETSTAWRLTFASHAQQADARQEQTNEVLRELTGVCAALNATNQHNNNH